MPFLSDDNPANLLNIGSVALWFAAKWCGGTPSQIFGGGSSSAPTGYLSTYTSQIGTGALTETIKSTALAYFDYSVSTATPTNQSTLDQLTQQFGQDYLNWLQVDFDYVFAGIANIAPSALVDTYEFDYLSVKQGCFTRMYSYPQNYQIQELGHYDYQNDCQSSDTVWDAKPYIALYGPPASCQNGTLQVTRWGLLFNDGRLSEMYISTDNLGNQ